MNILYFTHEREYGGSSRALITLLREIKKNKDNNIYVIVPFKDAKIISELKNLDVNIIKCFYSWWEVPINISKIKKIIFRILYYFVNFFEEKRLIKKIKKLNIDIIHSNTSVIDIGAKISKKMGIPHVWHFREFQENNLKFIKSEKKSLDFIEKSGGNIIYISKAVERYYKDKILKNNYRLIYDGISNQFVIEDKKYEEKKEEIKILLAGTLQKNKGQHIAIEALSILKKKGYNNIKLYLAGADPYDYSNFLNEIIQKNQIKENVEYLGFVNNIKEIRNKVNIELLCSKAEAFGLVTIEGMMAGNVVIGSNSGATMEIIEDGKTGLLFECNNPNSLAEKIEILINNKHMIQKIGKAGQEYVIEKFSSKKNAKEVLNYYNEILKR